MPAGDIADAAETPSGTAAIITNWITASGDNGGLPFMVIDKVAAMAHQAVDKAADAAVTTAERLVERGESLNATQKRLVSDTCSYVSAHPWKSVGFGVLAGFLLSRILL